MDNRTYLNIKSILLLVGVLIYSIYSCFVLYLVDFDWIKLSVQATPAVISLIFSYIIKNSKGETELDDWLLYISFTAAGACTCFTLFLNGETQYSVYLILTIVLGIGEVSFYRTKKIANLQIFTAFVIGTTSFLALEFSFEHKTIIIGLLTILLTWKYANSFYFKDYNLKHSEEIKIHTYRSTVATLNHELNNTSMIILGFTERFNKKDDAATLSKIEASLERMSNQIQILKSIDKIEFEDYLDSNRHQTIKLN